MTNVVLKEPCIDYLDAYNKDKGEYMAICTNTCKILDLDLVHMQKGDVNFASTYQLNVKFNSRVSAIISWFDCHFDDLKNKVTLSTSPYAPYTHWKNTIFYLDQAQDVNRDEKLTGSIAVRQSKENYRELDVKFSFHFSRLENYFTQLYKVR